MARGRNRHLKTQGRVKKNSEGGVVSAEMAAEAFEGPIPHPEQLAHYNQVLPGAADRLIKMAEEEQCHRHAQEEKALKSDAGDRWRARLEIFFGQLFAFLLCLSVIATGYFIATGGDAGWGSVLSVTGLAGIIKAYHGKK